MHVGGVCRQSMVDLQHSRDCTTCRTYNVDQISTCFLPDTQNNVMCMSSILYPEPAKYLSFIQGHHYYFLPSPLTRKTPPFIKPTSGDGPYAILIESDFLLSCEYALAFCRSRFFLLFVLVTTPASFCSASALASRSARFLLMPRTMGRGTFCRFMSWPVSALYWASLCFRACFPAKPVEPRACTSRTASSMSIALPPPAADADDFPSRPPLRKSAAAPPLLEELADRRVLPSMDRKSGKAEGHITTCTSFRCLFLLPPLAAEATFRAAAADDDDLAIILLGVCVCTVRNRFYDL
jgi:hypothetical protein